MQNARPAAIFISSQLVGSARPPLAIDQSVHKLVPLSRGGEGLGASLPTRGISGEQGLWVDLREGHGGRHGTSQGATAPTVSNLVVSFWGRGEGRRPTSILGQLREERF